MWTNVNYTFCRSAAAFVFDEKAHPDNNIDSWFVGPSTGPSFDMESLNVPKWIVPLNKSRRIWIIFWRIDAKTTRITIYRIFPGYIVTLTEVALFWFVRCFSIQVSLRYQWWNNVLKRSQKWSKHLLFPAGWGQIMQSRYLSSITSKCIHMDFTDSTDSFIHMPIPSMFEIPEYLSLLIYIWLIFMIHIYIYMYVYDMYICIMCGCVGKVRLKHISNYHIMVLSYISSYMFSNHTSTWILWI